MALAPAHTHEAMRACCLLLVGLLGCGASNNSTFDGGAGQPESGASDADTTTDASLQQGDATVPDAGGTAVIYAHTDDELYVMDPVTHVLTDVGPFDDGTGNPPVITDLAVNQNGEVWVNSVDSIYKATVPKTMGKVMIAKVVAIKVKVNQRFYAMGFTPPNVLGAAEMLVAGDSLGDVYAVDMQGNTTYLGAFGSDGNGGVYGLSGDILFYTQNGKPRGLATVRPYKNGTATLTTNDILAEIDVPAMVMAWNTKTPQPLRKQFLGTGTMFGRLYGIGAWNDSVYAFERLGSNNYPAQLIQIGPSGIGKSIQTFPNITAGWSGAGVTTNAPVTILPPN
jgi:hypothetical protein